uniref:Uncharacterized protein n=1 Tax=Anguilla anguilla TaxID=7936 RepID=A0A0E9U022_ANGAN
MAHHSFQLQVAIVTLTLECLTAVTNHSKP